MYKTIQTTTGQFSIQKLEKVLMHEHIVLGYAGWFYDPRCAEFDHAKAEEKTLGQAEAPARLRCKFGGGSLSNRAGKKSSVYAGNVSQEWSPNHVFDRV